MSVKSDYRQDEKHTLSKYYSEEFLLEVINEKNLKTTNNRWL